MRNILLSTKGEFKGYYIPGKDIPLGQFVIALSEEDIHRLGTGKGYWDIVYQRVIVFDSDGRAQIEMTPAHDQHLRQIKDSFIAEVDRKYRAGVKEHGGTLWTKPGLIEKAMEECVDQYTFLYTLKMQRDNPGMVDPEARDIDE